MSEKRQRVKNLFIPQEGNDNRPLILRPKVIAFMCVVLLVSEAVFIFGAKYLAPQSSLYGIIEANALVDETNQSRVANNLSALQVSSLLQTAAQEKANDMATKGYFAHTSPQGLTPWYWFQQVGYSFDYAGENLAVNFSDSQDVTNAWMNSPEHRANILSANFTQIGIATAQGLYNGEPATYVVEEFGTPAPVAVNFIDSASAASIPAPAPAPTKVVTPTAPTAPAKKPAPVSVPAKKPAVATLNPTTPIPAVVALQNATATDVQGASVAVKGASTQTVPLTQGSLVTIPAIVTSTNSAVPTVNSNAPVAQSNIVQELFSDPKMLANDFYLLLMVIFLLALVCNIFINIRVQYPRLIAGGLLVIVVAGLCIMLNQNIGFLHVVVL